MTATTQHESTALAVVQPGGFDLSPRNFEEAWRLAEIMADSAMVPKDYQGKPANCLIAIQWGAEVGLKALQAVQNIAVINGRPALWGDVMIALVRNSPLCEYVTEEISGDIARCRVKRRGEPEQLREFTKEDAAKAGLWNKQGPWQQYPKRMLQMRARAWALRDVFTDVLKGLSMAEEALDMPPPEKFMGAADVVTSTPAPGPASAQPAQPEKKLYPAEEFEKNFPAWSDVVAKGRKTPQGILQLAATRHPEWEMSEQQKARVLSLKQADPNATQQVSVEANAVAEQIRKAADLDQLAIAGDLIRLVLDQAQRDELQRLYDEREQELR
jgi:hypothetical protein